MFGFPYSYRGIWHVGSVWLTFDKEKVDAQLNDLEMLVRHEHGMLKFMGIKRLEDASNN